MVRIASLASSGVARRRGLAIEVVSWRGAAPGVIATAIATACAVWPARSPWPSLNIFHTVGTPRSETASAPAGEERDRDGKVSAGGTGRRLAQMQTDVNFVAVAWRW